MKPNIIGSKSFEFAAQIVELHKVLKLDKEFVLSIQLLRSGISSDANIRESQNAQSKADFAHNLYISQNECGESIYWLNLLKHTNHIGEDVYQKLNLEVNEMLKILKSIILSAKNFNS